MLAAIPFPDISAELFAFQIGGFEFALRWYALSYIVGILIGWWYIAALMRRPQLWGKAAPMEPVAVEGLVTAMVVGIIAGGRLGYVFVYDFERFLAHPVEILQVWNGGMSFHGGFAGVIVATILYCRNRGFPILSVGDAIAAAATPGLFLGRLANFVNAELWGRPTAVSWGVLFPGNGAHCPASWLLPCARHPSQLYEAGLEGIVLGLLLAALIFFGGALRRPGMIFGLFLIGYGLARSFVELFRQPDPQFVMPGNPVGYIVQFGEAGLTMGQMLSLPMVLIGLALLVHAGRRRVAA